VVSPLFRGVSLSYCEPSMPHSDAPSYESYDPAMSTQTWLFVLAVIRCYSAAVQPKKRGYSAVHLGSIAVFSVHISENSGGSARQ
jgi:hypothetical protein